MTAQWPLVRVGGATTTAHQTHPPPRTFRKAMEGRGQSVERVGRLLRALTCTSCVPPLLLLIFFVWVRLPASGHWECRSGVAFGFSFLPRTRTQRLTDSLADLTV
jgi:hypothetical protein